MCYYTAPAISIILKNGVDGTALSRSQVKGLVDKVERSNYDYSKLKRKEGKKRYSIKRSIQSGPLETRRAGIQRQKQY